MLRCSSRFKVQDKEKDTWHGLGARNACAAAHKYGHFLATVLPALCCALPKIDSCVRHICVKGPGPCAMRTVPRHSGWHSESACSAAWALVAMLSLEPVFSETSAVCGPYSLRWHSRTYCCRPGQLEASRLPPRAERGG